MMDAIALLALHPANLRPALDHHGLKISHNLERVGDEATTIRGAPSS
jgi:hypothetical protein